jgi:archaellin
MTKDEFLQLAEKTYSFTQLSAEKQQEILKLEGEEMDYYAQIFTEENEAMMNAVSTFEADNDKVINDFKISVKKNETQKLKSDEKAERKQDEKELSNLLKEI